MCGTGGESVIGGAIEPESGAGRETTAGVRVAACAWAENAGYAGDGSVESSIKGSPGNSE